MNFKLRQKLFSKRLLTQAEYDALVEHLNTAPFCDHCRPVFIDGKLANLNGRDIEVRG